MYGQNPQSFQNNAFEEKYLFDMNNNIKISNEQNSNINFTYDQDDKQKYRLAVCCGNLSDDEEEKDNNAGDDEYIQQPSENKINSNQEIKNAQINQEQPTENIIIDNQELKNVLIIEPVEGVQTNFFCVKEEGGKIGRHSSNQILILEESISRYHAEIIYQNKKFFLRDIGSATGTFIKIKDRIQIQLGQIFEMGSFQFEVIELNYKNQILYLRIVDDVKSSIEKNYKLELSSSGESGGVVSIGRKPTSKIYLPDDQHLSNLHAKFTFMNEQFFLEDNASTNGSWIRLSKESEKSELWEIENNTVIKIGSTSTYNCKFQHNVQKEQVISDGCIICASSDKDAVFLPCRHNVSCMKCSKTLQICPMCRTKIQDTVKIFKA